MLVYIELLFILLLAAVLYLIFKSDGLVIKSGLRRARVKECWDGKNRRQYPRFMESLEVAYCIVKKRVSGIASGKTVDISEGGAKLLLDEKLPLGTAINLKIALPDSQQQAELIGNVVWTEDASDIEDPTGKRFFYSGIKFSSTKDPSGKDFISFIRSRPPDQES
ncbi:MAG: PilZ domain-containing protein [Candidatus Omnitrophica bacterium]|nr:PilZ domain-containing protein [Candidatus Omnitrophota bacterium]MDD5437300.1 PilZ domain-containing protein [Candidatus Omnitrophota bacterium]